METNHDLSARRSNTTSESSATFKCHLRFIRPETLAHQGCSFLQIVVNVVGKLGEEVKKHVENILLKHSNGFIGSKLGEEYESIYAEAAPGTFLTLKIEYEFNLAPEAGFMDIDKIL